MNIPKSKRYNGKRIAWVIWIAVIIFYSLIYIT